MDDASWWLWYFWVWCWQSHKIVSLHQECNVANIGVTMQTQLNVSSNWIGCHWVLSLWSISHKKKILFSDLHHSGNYLAQFYLFQKNRAKEKLQKKCNSNFTLFCWRVLKCDYFKTYYFTKANFLQEAIGTQISSTINLLGSDYVLNNEKKNHCNFIKQNDLLCDIIYLFYYIMHVRIEMKWVFLV